MAESTLPPDLSVAPRCHHFRCKRAVERRVPFLCHRWLERCEVIEPRQHLAVRAVGAAAAALRPVRYYSAVGVSLFAPPPDAPGGVWGYGLRRQAAVFLRVPLRRQLRKDCRKIVFTGDHFFPGANRTFRPVPYSGNSRCLPAMAFFSPPPYFPVCPRQYLLGGQRRIFFGVPFFQQLWSNGRQRIFLQQDRSSGAIGTAGTAHAQFDRCLVIVALWTVPPDDPVAPHRHLTWGQRSIFLAVPFVRERRNTFGKNAASDRARGAPGAIRASGTA